jgi:hypothetical protein
LYADVAGGGSGEREDTMKFVVILGISVFCCAFAAQAESVTISKAVQENCQWDYDKFCNQYGLGSELLDMCFRQNGPKLSKGCVDALIAAGDVSKEYVDQQKRLMGR